MLHNAQRKTLQHRNPMLVVVGHPVGTYVVW